MSGLIIWGLRIAQRPKYPPWLCVLQDGIMNIQQHGYHAITSLRKQYAIPHARPSRAAIINSQLKSKLVATPVHSIANLASCRTQKGLICQIMNNHAPMMATGRITLGPRTGIAKLCPPNGVGWFGKFRSIIFHSCCNV